MNDVALAKLATIRRCLQRIRTVTAGDPTRVREIDTQDIVVLNLQRDPGLVVRGCQSEAAVAIVRAHARPDDRP